MPVGSEKTDAALSDTDGVEVVPRQVGVALCTSLTLDDAYALDEADVDLKM